MLAREMLPAADDRARQGGEQRPVRVERHDLASGPQYASHLGDTPLRIGKVMQETARDDRVELGVRERKLLAVRQQNPLLVPCGDGDHLRGEVGPGDVLYTRPRRASGGVAFLTSAM